MVWRSTSRLMSMMERFIMWSNLSEVKESRPKSSACKISLACWLFTTDGKTEVPCDFSNKACWLSLSCDSKEHKFPSQLLLLGIEDMAKARSWPVFPSPDYWLSASGYRSKKSWNIWQHGKGKACRSDTGPDSWDRRPPVPHQSH